MKFVKQFRPRDGPTAAEPVPRTTHFGIRLTPAERVALAAAAAAADVRPSDFARSAIFAGGPKADAPTPPPELVEDLAEIDRLRELSRIGTNLNQIARRLNAFDPAADDLGRVIEKLRVIETLRGWIDQETSSRRRRRQ